jgi:4'-phosphopantetheinyl transferase
MRFLRAEEVLATRSVAPLAAGEVHVWPLSLVAEEAVRQRFATLLDESESQRAGRYFHEKDRHGFILARGQMRHLLGLYCAVEGGSIRFTFGAAGKPGLAPDQPFAAGFSFNLTHSAGRALLAVTDGAELGVDLESHDRRTDVLALADRYFSPEESAQIAQTAESLRVAAFFRLWTAKEAVIKAHGEGLGVPLRAFSVAHAAPDGQFVSVRIFESAHLDEGWFVRLLPTEAGWNAALAARSPREVRVIGSL